MPSTISPTSSPGHSESGALDKFIQTGMDTLAQLGDILPHAVDLFEKLIPLGVVFTPILVTMVEKFLALLGALSEMWTVMLRITPVFTIWGGLFDFLKGHPELFVAKIKWLGEMFGWMKDQGKDAFEKIEDKAIRVKSALADMIPDSVRVMWETFWDALKAKVDRAIEDIKGKMQELKDFLINLLPPWAQALLEVADWATNRTTTGNAVAAPDQTTPPAPGQPAAPAPTPPGGLGTTAGAVPITQNPNGTWTSTNKAWADLIKRESTGNPTAIQGDIGDINNATGDLAKGLFQITDATWAANGGLEFGVSQADKATPQQQAVVAGRIFAARGGQPWGAVPGGGREDESALRAGLAPGSTPSVPSPASPGGVPSSTTTAGTGPAQPGEQIGTQAIREHINQKLGMNTVTGWRPPDTYDEHSGGNAIDVMVGNDTTKGMQVLTEALAQPNVDFCIYQQKMWYPDGSSKGMEDRGSPTANHMDHVHIHVKSTGYAPGNEPSATGKARGANAAPAPGTPATGPLTTNGPGGADSHIIPLSQNIPPGQMASASKNAKGMGEQLGQDIVSGMMEVFGFGDIFKDPTEFGIFKIFKSLMGVKIGGQGQANGGPTNATDGSGGGQNPMLGILEQFIPGMGGGNTGVLSALSAPGQLGAPPGPTSVDNSMNVTVQGNVTPPVLNTMNTEHLTHTRNTPRGPG